MIFRTADISDVAALAAMRWSFRGEEGEGVGLIQSIPRPSRASDQWGYLTDCHTLARFRNQGVGSALPMRIARWAEDRDLEMLLVWPSEKALSLYTKAGFTRDDAVRVLRIRAYDDPIRPRADA